MHTKKAPCRTHSEICKATEKLLSIKFSYFYDEYTGLHSLRYVWLFWRAAFMELIWQIKSFLFIYFPFPLAANNVLRLYWIHNVHLPAYLFACERFASIHICVWKACVYVLFWMCTLDIYLITKMYELEINCDIMHINYVYMWHVYVNTQRTFVDM